MFIRFYSLIRRLRPDKGYTLLFAVIVSILVLSIAAFILSVSRKQFLLSSASRDSMYAFYAADSGLECAVENRGLLATSSPQAGTPSDTLTCGIGTGGGAGTWSIARMSGASGAGTSTFSMFVGTNDSGGSACVTVRVGQWYDTSGNIVTNIESRGYNIGWNAPPNGAGTGDCSVTGPRKAERALKLTYQ